MDPFRIPLGIAGASTIGFAIAPDDPEEGPEQLLFVVDGSEQLRLSRFFVVSDPCTRLVVYDLPFLLRPRTCVTSFPVLFQ